MFFNGYLVVNSLETKFLGKVIQQLKANNLLEQAAFSEESNMNKAPVISVSLFTFNKYMRTLRQQKDYVSQSLAQDMVEIHMGARLEEQK